MSYLLKAVLQVVGGESNKAGLHHDVVRPGRERRRLATAPRCNVDDDPIFISLPRPTPTMQGICLIIIQSTTIFYFAQYIDQTLHHNDK